MMVDSHNDADTSSDPVYLPSRSLPAYQESLARAIADHTANCTLRTESISARVRTLETKLATLIGLMLGAGTLGGAIGSYLQRLFP